MIRKCERGRVQRKALSGATCAEDRSGDSMVVSSPTFHNRDHSSGRNYYKGLSTALLMFAALHIYPGSLAMGSAAAADQQNVDLAEAIVSLIESESGRDLDKSYRQRLKARLAKQSTAQLEVAINSGSGLTSDLTGSTAAVGQSGDLVYTAVSPCRIIDTREAGGPLSNNVQRDFIAAGSPFNLQGGIEGDCGVPFGPAKAVMLNVTTTGWSGGGFVNGWAAGSPAPLSSLINYGRVSGLPALANGVIVPICDLDDGGICPEDLTFMATGGTTSLIVDVIGYFSKKEPLSFYTRTGKGELGRSTHCSKDRPGFEGTFTCTSTEKGPTVGVHRVDCDPGDVATNGGYSVNSVDPSVVIRLTAPWVLNNADRTPIGWFVEWHHSPAPQDEELELTTVCADIMP